MHFLEITDHVGTRHVINAEQVTHLSLFKSNAHIILTSVGKEGDSLTITLKTAQYEQIKSWLLSLN